MASSSMDSLNLSVPKGQTALSVSTRTKLAERAIFWREKWNQEKQDGRDEWNPKTKRHKKKDPKWGFIVRTVEENFPALKGLKRDVSR